MREWWEGRCCAKNDWFVRSSPRIFKTTDAQGSCKIVWVYGGGGVGGGEKRKKDGDHELMNCVQYMSESCLN